MNKTNRLIFLFVLILIMLLPATPASAALSRCRVDPIFVLSNGDVVAVTVDVATDPSRISHVTYVLHVPVGVTVKQVIHTSRGFGVKEIYQVYQDNPTSTYISDTVVAMHHSTGVVAVTAYARLNGILKKSVSGYSGQHLWITVSRS